jgi:hypothetical protein
MGSAVRQATAAYAQVGRGLLAQATAEDADLNTVSAEAFAQGKFNFFGFGSTECRMALALARFRRANGQLVESRAFAAHALEVAGSAAILRAQIQALLQ